MKPSCKVVDTDINNTRPEQKFLATHIIIFTY